MKVVINTVACLLLFFPALQAVFIAIHLGVGNNKIFSLAIAFIPTWLLLGVWIIYLCLSVTVFLAILLGSLVLLCKIFSGEEVSFNFFPVIEMIKTVVMVILTPLVVGPGLFLFFALSPDPVVQAMEWPAWSALIVIGIWGVFFAMVGLLLGLLATIKVCGSEQLRERVKGFTSNSEDRLLKWRRDMTAFENEERTRTARWEEEEERRVV